MESRENNSNSRKINSMIEYNNKSKVQDQNEFQKMSEYCSKISECRSNCYKNYLTKKNYCDCFLNGEWTIGYIYEKNPNYITVLDFYQYKNYNNTELYNLEYSNKVAYFRKYTKPSSNNLVPYRLSKKVLIDIIDELLKPERKNIFKDNKDDNNPKVIFDIYYFFHKTLYFSFDFSICKGGKEKTNGVEEGVKIINIILEYISEFYHYINANFDEFINYENNIVGSELSDMVLFNKKYAIFSFWDDANLLMNKIFLNNQNNFEWFVESEKILNKILPSSPNMKKISSKDKLLCPLYDDQINNFKLQKYNYTLTKSNNLKLRRICVPESYENKKIDYKVCKIPIYILSYFIDYFYAIGGYHALFLLCRENYNIKISINIFDNIHYACHLTNNFRGCFENERNGINKVLFKFLESINEDTFKKYTREEIIKFLEKGAGLYPNINDKSSFFFEEIYLRYMLSYVNLAKKNTKRLEAINDIVNILYSIEYNELSNENNNAKNIDELINLPKFSNRDEHIHEMKYSNFCSNCKNNELIEILFKDKKINEEILEKFSPILFVMYQNDFGYIHSHNYIQQINNTKKLVLDTILNKLKESESENINTFMKIEKILCEFCEVLTDEDKYFIFSEIKTLFYNSFFNQKITFKEIFDFVIKYSSIAVKKTNLYQFFNEENNDGKGNNNDINDNNKKHKDNIDNNNNNKIKNNNVFNINSIDESEINGEEIVDLTNFTFDEKKYYGLELIYSYLSFEQYQQLQMNEQQKIEFINLASEGVVKILSNIKLPEFAINIILNKIYNSIKNKKDVLQHLFLLQKLLNYAKFDNFSISFNKLFDEFLKKNELIIVLIDELSSFLEQLKKNIVIDNNKNDININTNINEIENRNQNENAYLNENKNIETRIHAIFIVILKYKDIKIDFTKIQEFFIKLINFNEFSKDTLYQDLLKYINNFSNSFINNLYTNIISNKNIFKINNFVTYKICKNIIIQINKLKNYLFLMNNKDIGLYVNLNKKDIEQEIIGFKLLWNLLLNEEQNLDINIINDLTDFICNLYYGVRIKSPTNMYKEYEQFWINTINNISNKLKELLEQKDKNIKAIRCFILIIKKIINKTNNINGEIIKDFGEIKKESNKFISNNRIPPKEFSFVGIKDGKDNYFNIDIKLNNGDLFYILRYQLSSYYKIPVNQIQIDVYINTKEKVKTFNKNTLENLILNSNKNFRSYSFTFLNDFENIYNAFNYFLDFENKGNKKYSLLIEVKQINNVCKDIMKLNPIDIIYNKTNLPITLMNLLKEGEAPYTFDVLCLIRGNNNDNYSTVIINSIEKIIMNNGQNENNSLFNFENKSIYYISFIISNLYNAIQKNINNKFLEKFLNSNIWNNHIKNLKIIDDEYIVDNNKNLPLLGELYEKYNLINNLVNIYVSIAGNLSINDNNLIWFIIYKIIKIYNYIIKESMNINLNKCGKSERISIDDIKKIFNESLTNINYLIINNDKILKGLVDSLISNDNNKAGKKIIKSNFEYIIFESILKNKYKSINKRIKSLLIDLVNKVKKNNQNEDLKLYNYLLELYLTENSLNKIIKIFQEISQANKNINEFRYENNIKILFEMITEVLSNIYEFIKDKFNPNGYINNVLLPRIYNYNIPYIPLQSIFHQLILGAVCKLFYKILLIDNNCFNLSYEKNKQLIDYIFDTIIMSKCNEKILTPENINNENNSVVITSSFCIKEASNLFILLLFKENHKNEPYNYYIQKLTSFHNLCFWKGNNLSDWKLYYKESQKSTPFVGLKNLGCTCYINSLIQTFYHLPLLRESLLKCDCPISKKNCFYQLKIIFYSLKYLQTSYYVPSSFTENYDDQQLNVNAQMDAFEFFCDFLEKIEKKIKNTKNENIIKYFFMGRQNDVINFEGNCNHNRTNESQFYSIQLQVQGKKDIYDSLDTLIAGERMDGENCIECPQCNKKFPAIKSQNFKTLPRIFMFVLKRFEFNFQTMQKTKINDYYEFPMILDMNKYTEEFINNKKSEDNKYKLKSIIIHSGNCDAGHYYAYILDEKSQEWYEFNDINIKKFDINNLNLEAFGKLDIITDENGNQIEVENTRNAYMLFYEKINKDNCEKFDNIDVINELFNIKNNNINTNNRINEVNNKININKQKTDENDFNLLNDNNINEINENDKNSQKDEIQKILDPLNQEMFKYFLSKKIFSGEYHHFILSLLLNILIKIIKPDKMLSFPENLCSNEYTSSLPKEIKNYKIERKNPELSNLENYLLKKQILLFESRNQYNNINEIDNNNNNEISKDIKEKILELFKILIIYFFNVMIRAREKDFLGGTVDLIKYLINNYSFCADYLVEEFSNYNVLIEYILNCPSYETKKLVVGIIYCAMIKCVTSYEKKMKQKDIQQKQIQSQNHGIQEKNLKSNHAMKNEQKVQEKKNNNIEEKGISDEEYARRLQEEFNRELRGNSNNNINNRNDSEINSNPLNRKYIPQNVLKLVYNTLYMIKNLGNKYINESRFLYLILFRFSLISKKTKKFLLNKALLLEFLNLTILPKIREENHEDDKILMSIDKGLYTINHDILNTHKKKLEGIVDKGGAFHYENYITMLYFYLLSHEQKQNPKHPYFEGSYNFDNKKFIKALFFKINTKQDAFIFFYIVYNRCLNNKKRIDNVLSNIVNILARADNNDKINYDVNTNRDNYNKGAYGGVKEYNSINYEEDFPKINPKYLLLIFKRFILAPSNDNKLDEYRINNSLKYIFKILENNNKFYNFSIMLIEFLIELFTNYFIIMKKYINNYSKNLKEIIQWINNYPISPELYPIEGISMYKDDNVVYKQNINEDEKYKFDRVQKEKSKKRVQKLTNILELKVNGYDNDFEADFDLTDFKFRKGDYILYNKKRAIIKEHLDELIYIKIIDKEEKENKKDNKKNINQNDEEEKITINDIEKVKFWVAKDDKKISIYNLE